MDLGVGGVSKVELLIMFELFTKSRLKVEKAVALWSLLVCLGNVGPAIWMSVGCWVLCFVLWVSLPGGLGGESMEKVKVKEKEKKKATEKEKEREEDNDKENGKDNDMGKDKEKEPCDAECDSTGQGKGSVKGRVEDEEHCNAS